MWTATVVSKDFRKGVLLVGVEYTNGTEAFDESIDMSGGTSDDLQGRIQFRLTTLNQSEAFLNEVDQTISSKEKIEPEEEI